MDDLEQEINKLIQNKIEEIIIGEHRRILDTAINCMYLDGGYSEKDLEVFRNGIETVILQLKEVLMENPISIETLSGNENKLLGALKSVLRAWEKEDGVSVDRDKELSSEPPWNRDPKQAWMIRHKARELIKAIENATSKDTD